MNDLTQEVIAELEAIRERNEAAIVARELEAIRTKLEWDTAFDLLRRSIDNLHRYVYVEPCVVPYAAAVTTAVDEFAADLGISTPELRFFVPESCRENAYVRRWGDADRDGFGYPTQIRGLCRQWRDGRRAQVLIAADLADEWDAIATTAHEVRHAAQPWDMPKTEAEADAEAYATAVSAERRTRGHR